MSPRFCLLLIFFALLAVSGTALADTGGQGSYILLAQNKAATPSKSTLAEIEKLNARIKKLHAENADKATQKEAYEQLYRLELEAYGEDYQAKSTTGPMLVAFLNDLKEYKEAEELCARLVSVHERLSSDLDGHPFFMTNLFCSTTYFDQNKFEQAREPSRLVFESGKKYQSMVEMTNPYYPLTLAALQDWATYEEVVDDLLRAWENVTPGSDNASFFPGRLIELACATSGGNYYTTGFFNPEQSVRLLTRLQPLAQKKLKKNDPDLLEIDWLLSMAQALDFIEKEKYPEALDIYAKLFSLRHKYKITGKTKMLYLVRHLIEPHYKYGRSDQADQMLAELKNDLRAQYNPKDDYDLSIMRRLITLPYNHNQYWDKYGLDEPPSAEDAASYRAVIAELEDFRREIGPQSLRGLEAGGLIGRIYIRLKDFDRGEEIMRAAHSKMKDSDDLAHYEGDFVICKREVLGSYHKFYFDSDLDEIIPKRLHWEGWLLMEKGRYDEAKTIFRQARQWMLKGGTEEASESSQDKALPNQAQEKLVVGQELASGPYFYLRLVNHYLTALAEFKLGRPEVAERMSRAALKAMGNDYQAVHQNKFREILEMVADSRLAKKLAREADSLNAQGKFDEARGIYAQLYSSLEKLLGPQAPETLTARYNLARMYENGGQSAVARDLYQSLLKIQEQVLGTNHQDTLATRERLAQLASAPSAGAARAPQSDAPGAGTGSTPTDKAALNQELAEREKKSGKDHPDTLAVREKLADLLVAENDHVKAEKEYAVIAALRERKQGREHLATLTSREKQAQALAAQGKPEQALKIYSQVLPVRERIQGPDHQDVEATLMGLVALYDQKGDSAAARTVTDRLQDIHDGKKLKGDPTAIPSSESTADMAAEFGSYKSALDGYERALAVKRRVLGPEDPATLAVRQKAAVMMSRLGDHAGAKAQHSAIMEIRIRVLGPENPATLDSKLNLASACLALKDRSTAEKLLKEVLAVQERTLGPKHPDTLNTRQMLGQ